MDELDSDAALVARARIGDADAFERLVRRHLRSCLAVARARVRDPADAEDVVQDAFVTAIERLDDCRSPERFGAWLHGIVRHRALDHQRYRRIREAESVDDEVHGTEASPLLELERTELRVHLTDGLATLTALQREVLVLFDHEGWSHRDIARKLGITEGSSRVHLHNARRALRTALAPWRPEAHG